MSTFHIFPFNAHNHPERCNIIYALHVRNLTFTEVNYITKVKQPDNDIEVEVVFDFWMYSSAT